MAAKCPFCDLIARFQTARFEPDPLLREVHVIEPLNPVTAGHLLVVPALHVRDSRSIPAVTGRTFQWAAQFASQLPLAEDFNLIVNDGEDASQTVEHLHVHIVPRRPADGLMLPWTGQPR